MTEPRILPWSAEAERTILGAILNDNAMWNQAKVLESGEFSLDSHRRIFSRMNDLAENGTAIDMITVAEELGRARDLEAVGGIAYLASLTSGLPHRPNIEQYVRIVKEKAALRSIIVAANIVVSLAMDEDRPASMLAELMHDKLSDLSANCTSLDNGMFVPARELIEQTPRTIDWRVDGVIEQGTSGFIIGLPKASKSFVAAYLAVCLSTGLPWFDLNVTPCRVALVAREDRPETTARRIRRILADKGLPAPAELLINTRKQTPRLMLDNAGELNALIRSLKRHQSEFLILDVLNVLHDKDENDNAEMRSVLKRVEQIRAEVGCQVCIIHHARKKLDDGDTLSQSTRGASAISGFAEFIINVRLVDEPLQIRQLAFETKAAEPKRPFAFKIQDREGAVEMKRVEWEAKPKGSRISKAAIAK